MRFGAILGRFMARGCNPEAIRMNCFRIALNLQSSHNLQDCVMIAKNLRTRFLRLPSIERIAEDPQGQGSNRNPWQLSEWAQSRSNPSAICLNCTRITQNPESSCNRPDCKYRGRDCGGIATIRKSSFWGLWGTERIAWDPRARVWACPPVWAQT